MCRAARCCARVVEFSEEKGMLVLSSVHTCRDVYKRLFVSLVHIRFGDFVINAVGVVAPRTLFTLHGRDRCSALLSLFLLGITIELSPKENLIGAARHSPLYTILSSILCYSCSSGLLSTLRSDFCSVSTPAPAAVEERKGAGPFVQDGRPADFWPRRRHFPRYLRPVHVQNKQRN